MDNPDRCKFILLEWERVHDLCKWIAREIKNEGFKPDAIVAIARGGWCAGNLLSDQLSIKDLRSVKIEHWGYTGRITGEAKITQPIVGELDGKDILLVDDITDTGDSMRLALRHLEDLKINSVKTAVLKHKSTSTLKPDFIGTEMDDWKWVVFPWNINEDIMNIIEMVVISNGMPIDSIEYKLRGEFDLCIGREELYEIMNDMEQDGRVISEGVIWRRRS
ncbi:MAG: phosphoribosyltransferase [Halobacteriota archaeon]|nr:phosphoribosyltransferase [Halobacteriota archaeon]